MSEFPSPLRIIEELNECQSYIKTEEKYPRKGEVEAAMYITELAEKWGLGKTERIPLPRKAHKFDRFVQEEEELHNVIIDTGEGNEEMLFLHAHFDVVPPFDYASAESARLVQDSTRANIYRGLGSYDMLSGVAAILTALRNMQVAHHRRVRAVFVFGEENDSEGTHAAFDPGRNIFDFSGQKLALSTEITVGADLETEPHLVIGRPGRFALNANIYGQAMHAGDVTDANVNSLTCVRGAKSKLELLNFKSFNRHPHDTRNLLQPGRIAIGEYQSDKPRSLSSAGREDMEINIHYADPNVTNAEMHEAIRKALVRILGDDNFDLKQPKRDLPWTQPWLEELDQEGYAYPHLLRDFAGKALGVSRQHVSFRAGTGVADENIIAAHRIPVVCIPPRGEGAHTAEEKVDIRSVTNFQIPIIQSAAAYPHSLMHGRNGK